MSRFDDFLNRKNRYCFNTTWRFDEPIEKIWNELVNYEKWPAWCNGLEKIEPVDPYDHLRKGNNIRSIWKGALPYTITFDAVIKEFIQYSFLSFRVTGDLCGEGICHFLSSPGHTAINLIWDVSPTKLWMKMSSPIARPVFIENHNHIMALALTGFSQMLAQGKERPLG